VPLSSGYGRLVSTRQAAGCGDRKAALARRVVANHAAEAIECLPEEMRYGDKASDIAGLTTTPRSLDLPRYRCWPMAASGKIGNPMRRYPNWRAEDVLCGGKLLVFWR
jgi:hypothetical protein